MKLVLRDHQLEILDKLRAGFSSHRSQVLYGPCGFGKTEVAIAMMEATQANGKKAAMVVDRRILCTQTSARLWKYGIDHGVLMARSDRWRPDLPIQICTAQTLEARDSFPDIDLLIVDEAHCQRDSVITFIKNRPRLRVVGLSGSPFTKGMGQTYSNVETAATIHKLVASKWLIEPRVFIAKEIDMKGAKKVAGEWSAKEATARGIQITGDIVAEWVTKTNEIFCGPRKTIVFSAGVAHGEDLARQFAASGYNFISISYRDDDDYKAEVLANFAKPDTDINGIIATDILTKGFDQSDVLIGVSARPFSKSFSSHVQQIGRVMRPHDGKSEAIWLCHSGNYLRFKDQWDALCADGVSILDDGAEKAKKEPTDKEKEAAKCPKCGALWSGRSDVCSHCGHVRTRKNDVVSIAGEMVELSEKKTERYSSEYREAWYQGMISLLRYYGKNEGRAFFLYIEKFGMKPSWKKQPGPITSDVVGYLHRSNIAFAKSKGRNRHGF